MELLAHLNLDGKLEYGHLSLIPMHTLHIDDSAPLADGRFDDNSD